MNFNKYKNLFASSITALEYEVNRHIAKGCTPLGGMSILKTKDSIIYVQSMVLTDDANDIFGSYISTPQWLLQVAEFATSGSRLAAVKLYKENANVGLKEAKDWVDANYPV